MELAERLDRLWAALIDRLLIVLVAAVAALMLRANGGVGGAALIYVFILVSLLAILAANIWLLTTRGQTIGKRIIGLRIVKVADMTNGGVVTNVLLRVVVNAAISMIPFVGAIYFLVDPLFIFRDDRRCVHDHIAGTCVIKA